MAGAELIVAAGQAWLVVGLGVAVAFLLFGLDRIDASARGAYGFRPLLLPGLVLLWPLVLRRWLAAPAPDLQPPLWRRHKRLHAAIWAGLALLLPAILATALALRQHDLPKPSSVRIAPAPGGGE